MSKRMPNQYFIIAHFAKSEQFCSFVYLNHIINAENRA